MGLDRNEFIRYTVNKTAKKIVEEKHCFSLTYIIFHIQTIG